MVNLKSKNKTTMVAGPIARAACSHKTEILPHWSATPGDQESVYEISAFDILDIKGKFNSYRLHEKWYHKINHDSEKSSLCDRLSKNRKTILAPFVIIVDFWN